MRKVYRNFSFLFILAITFSCSDRGKNNPYDPEGSNPLKLNILGLEQSIILSWSEPGVNGHGYNLYRSDTGDEDSYSLIARDLPWNNRSYSDTNITSQQRYFYYLTVLGEGLESNPSNIVSTFPGPGYIWILDGPGHEVLKCTYDLQSVLLRFNINWNAADMALAANLGRGLICYPGYGFIEQFSLENGAILQMNEDINHPYATQYDSTAQLFWVLDSSGYLYSVDPATFTSQLISDIFKKPISVSLAEKEGYLYIVDKGVDKVFQLNRQGEVLAVIDNIAGQPLSSPKKFLHDELSRQYWLLENSGNSGYIYTKSEMDSLFSTIDTTSYISDMEISIKDESVYLAETNEINSHVLQLYPNGSRQIAVAGFYYLHDIEVNRYSASVLVTDIGYGSVIHYDKNHQFIGSISYLYLPNKVLVE